MSGSNTGLTRLFDPVATPFRGLNLGSGQAMQWSMTALTALTGAAASGRESLRSPMTPPLSRELVTSWCW